MLAYLEGRWRLERRIEDRRAGIVGRFDGTCDWVPDGQGLRQVEEGVLQYGTAAPMRASRVYLWRAEEDGLAVLFEDGRPFHRLGADRVADRHHCPPDIYDVRYDFGDWPQWMQEWTVTGPRKDATLTSRFYKG